MGKLRRRDGRGVRSDNLLHHRATLRPLHVALQRELAVHHGAHAGAEIELRTTRQEKSSPHPGQRAVVQCLDAIRLRDLDRYDRGHRRRIGCRRLGNGCLGNGSLWGRSDRNRGLGHDHTGQAPRPQPGAQAVRVLPVERAEAGAIQPLATRKIDRLDDRGGRGQKVGLARSHLCQPCSRGFGITIGPHLDRPAGLDRLGRRREDSDFVNQMNGAPPLRPRVLQRLRQQGNGDGDRHPADSQLRSAPQGAAGHWAVPLVRTWLGWI